MSQLYYTREIDAQIHDAFSYWRIVLLFGARQIGKTTMAEHYFETITVSKKKFLGQNSDVQKKFSSCSLTTIRSMIGDAKFIFIDEAQYIPEIGTVLKLIFDALTDVQVLVTGSSAFGLASKTSESMTGRKTTLNVFPLSFREVAQNDIYTVPYSGTSVAQFLVHGTYPRVLSVSDMDEKNKILLELSESYLYKDVLSFQGVRKAPMVAKLAQMLALQIGNQVSLTELARSLEINKETVQHYIDVLIRSYIIFPLQSLSRNPRKELHKSMKYYFYDTGIRNAVIKNFSDLDLRNDVGALWENFVVSEMYKRYSYDKKIFGFYHWRTYDQKEVDLVIEENGTLKAFECKFSGGEEKVKKTTSDSWAKSYPEVPIQVINSDNFVHFLR